MFATSPPLLQKGSVNGAECFCFVYYLLRAQAYTLSVKKKTGEKWPNYVLGDQILTGLKF